jgi:hypothetical protein
MKRNGFLYVLIWTLIILLIAGLTFGIYTLFNGTGDPDDDDPIIIPKDPVITADFEGYTVYKLDEISFPFVIARITFASDSAMSFDMDQLITSEQLSLAQTQVYQDELLANGLDLSYQMVDFELPKNKQTFTVNVFIPVKNPEAEKITLTTKFKSNISLVFDLTFAQGVKEMLGYVEEPGVITDNETYKLKVLGLEDLTSFPVMRKYDDGTNEEVTFPSTAKIYAVKVSVTPLNNSKLVIVQGRYRIITSGQTALSMTKDYFIEGFENIVSLSIDSPIEGYLIFDVYSTELSLLDQNTIFEVRFDGSEDWIEITIIE